jgi:hypothetical protein
MARQGAALEREVANNEIDRPKSLCICARDQRLIVEPSFREGDEMRCWLVLRSRHESLRSRRRWWLKSSPLPRQRQPAAVAHDAVADAAATYNTVPGTTRKAPLLLFLVLVKRASNIGNCSGDAWAAASYWDAAGCSSQAYPVVNQHAL